MLKVAFDIGGVISKFPNEFAELIRVFNFNTIECHVITDMHDKDMVVKQLKDNAIDIPSERVHISDYQNLGEMCKAVLLKELKIDIFIDDFAAYHSWDSQLGPAPIRLMVQPDPFRPYWHPEWQTDCESDFGRRVSPQQL